MPDNNNNKPVKPVGLVRVSTGGDVERDKTFKGKQEQDVSAPGQGTSVGNAKEGRVSASVKRIPKRVKKSRQEAECLDRFLSTIDKAGNTTISEMREIARGLEKKTVEQLLESPEGIAFLAIKNKFSFHPELPLEMNRFIARINMEPQKRPRLTGEEKKMTYNERYPHMQLPRKYINEAEAIANRANVPTTVIIRHLLDIAFATIGIKVTE